MDLNILKDKLESITVETSEWNRATETDVRVKVSPEVFIEGDQIHVNGETDNGYLFMDYYGEFRGGFPWISPELEAFAKEVGGYWEWDHPGSISLAL